MIVFDFTNTALPRLCVNCDQPFFPGEALLICDQCSLLMPLEDDISPEGRKDWSVPRKSRRKKSVFRGRRRAIERY